ncbi:transposase [Enterococcus silesiacus]|uniref:Transposase n=1 Tax=Enterococcus silesiacus TaxID=332949 RepID=A0AA91JQ58_9ENTE|nr:IS3 family transposase [Enterococcus silesiacus]OJG92869.1 transposase [Enterococcus silesiacus]
MIELARSTFNNWKKQLVSKEKVLHIEGLIQIIFEENDPNHGYRRINLTLVNRGYQINHKKIRQIMKKYNLVCTRLTHRSRSYRSYKGLVGTLAKIR